MGCEGAGGADRLIRRVFHVGVEHQGEALAKEFAHGGDLDDIFRQPVPPDLHLDRAETLGEISFGLRDQLIRRQHQVDAARIDLHRRVGPAKMAPERLAGLFRGQIPERDVERGLRQHRRPAAPAIMHGPPDLAPDMLNPAGLFAGNDLRHLFKAGVDGASIVAAGIGVADAFRAVAVGHAGGDNLEPAHLAVHRVGQHLLQRDEVEVRPDGCDGRRHDANPGTA